MEFFIHVEIEFLMHLGEREINSEETNQCATEKNFVLVQFKDDMSLLICEKRYFNTKTKNANGWISDSIRQK